MSAFDTAENYTAETYRALRKAKIALKVEKPVCQKGKRLDYQSQQAMTIKGHNAAVQGSLDYYLSKGWKIIPDSAYRQNRDDNFAPRAISIYYPLELGRWGM